nr:MAG TPA: hypothetical protein [Caudoviricetes sp.]
MFVSPRQQLPRSRSVKSAGQHVARRCRSCRSFLNGLCIIISTRDA